MKYDNPNKTTAVPDSVASALRRFFTDDVMPKADRRTMSDTNVFRDSFCYVEDVDEVLKRWEQSLRNIFKAYAFGDGKMDELWSTDMLGYDEWKDFVLDMGFYDVVDFAAREAALAFAWSRLREIDERPLKAKVRMMQLSFEEFMEALIRISSFKVIPSDSDVYEAGCEDAGELMIKRQALPRVEQDALLRETVCDWDDPLPQPMFHLLEGLLSYMARVITGGNPTKVSSRDATKFKQANDESVEGKESKRARIRRGMLDVFTVKPIEAANAFARELTQEQMVMASLFGCVNGSMPNYEDDD